MSPLWMVPRRFPNHTWSLSAPTFAWWRLRSALEPYIEKNNACLNKCPETKGVSSFEMLSKDHVWSYFTSQKSPQAQSIHPEGAAVWSFSEKGASRAGCDACSANCPQRQVSGSRLDIVKSCPSGTQALSPSCFTTQKRWEMCVCSEIKGLKVEGIDSEAAGKQTSNVHSRSHGTGCKSKVLHANRPGETRSPEDEEERCERIYNERVGNIDDLLSTKIHCFLLLLKQKNRISTEMK